MGKWSSFAICFMVLAVYSIAAAQQGFYSIHISSHKQQAPADTEVRKLQKQGLDAFVRHMPVKGKGMWYRVFIGKFATPKQASEEMRRLKKMKVSDYFAVKKLSEKAAAAGADAAAAQAKKTAAKAKVRTAEPKPGDYYLFVGFYRDLEPARKAVARLNQALAARGYRAFVTRQKAADGTNYRVYIGTFDTRQQADDIGARWKDQNLLPSFYMPVPTTQDMISGRMPDTAAGASESKAAAGDQPAVAPSTEGAAAQTQKPAGKAKKDKPVAGKRSPAAGIVDSSRFALTLKTGAFSPSDADEFAVADATTLYRVSDDAALQIGVEGMLRFNKHFGLYGNVDSVFIDGVDWYNVSAGPVLTYQASKSVMPYLKAGAVYGNFSWDAPGDFDQDLGWEAGAGVHFMETNFKFGIGFAYRDLSFDFEPPDDPSVIASEDSIDMGGYSLLATFTYFF